MGKNIPRHWQIGVLTSVLFCLAAIGIAAQDDTDPNSPTPVVLTDAVSTRALAIPADGLRRMNLDRISPRSFPPDDSVVLFVTNITPISGEGANAFRVLVQDTDGKMFRFPVTNIIEYPNKGDLPIYALTVKMKDELGFWSAPAEGDVLIGVTWRGLMSNRVRLGFGSMGGPIKDDPGSVPTPVGYYGGHTKAPKQIQPDYVGYRWSGDRTRLLEQATFGPTPQLDEQLRRMGPHVWIEQQLNASYPSSTNPYPNQPLKPNNAAADCDGEQTIVPDVPATCKRDTYSMYQPQTWFMREAFYGDAQLRHRVAWALAQLWVTSGVDIQQGRHMVEYYKILANNAFGNYRTLMKQMTLSPTMGSYLSMASSTKNNPNENYAREIMQLFTVGLYLLNQDGTVKLDGQGNPIPTYTQANIDNLKKVFTGWSFCNSAANCPNFTAGTTNYIDPMSFTRNNHDLTAKTLLTWPADPEFPPHNSTIAACSGCTGTAIDTYASTSLDAALDNIFYHPNLGPYVSRYLIQQLVTSDPTPAYVGRIAAVFNNDGTGVRGNLGAVVKAILLDPEARGDIKTDPGFGKLREPVQLLTSLARQFNVRSADGTADSDGFVTGRSEFTGMGQTPFMSPTVFNFYPPGYVVPGTSINGPEFAVMNTGTSITRANFFNRFVFTPGAVPVAPPNAPNGTGIDISDLQALAAADTSGGQLVDDLDRRLLHSTMTTQMRNTILTAVTAIPTSQNEFALARARQALYLVATSAAYQVQR